MLNTLSFNTLSRTLQRLEQPLLNNGFNAHTLLSGVNRLNGLNERDAKHLYARTSSPSAQWMNSVRSISSDAHAPGNVLNQSQDQDQKNGQRKKIGFIGVGNMGGPMAVNLVNAGHQVKVFDLSPTLVKNVVAEGADSAATVQEAAKDIDVLISMLPSGEIVESLYIDSEALLDTLSKETLVIDSSTIAPKSAQRVSKEAIARGIRMIDAPVSGGTAGATLGTLTFIVGGDKLAFQQAKPILEDMGKNIFHAGRSGSGQVAKICNNMLLAIHMAGTAEALHVGINNGLDPKVLSDIMLQSSGRNWSLELYNPVPGVMEGVPSSNNYEGGFQIDLMSKDLTLALNTALESDSSVPMGSLAKTLYATQQAKGEGTSDFSSILKFYEKSD